MSKTGRPSERGSISSISSTPLPSAQNQLRIEPHRSAQSLRSLRRIRGHWGSTRPWGSACSRSLPQMERLNAACRRRETRLRRTRTRRLRRHSHDAQNLVVALRRAAASDRYRSQPRAEEHRRQSSDADLHGPSWPIRLVRSRLADQRPELPIRLVRSRLARPEFTVPAELDLPSAGGVGVSRAASYGR